MGQRSRLDLHEKRKGCTEPDRSHQMPTACIIQITEKLIKRLWPRITSSHQNEEKAPTQQSYTQLYT